MLVVHIAILFPKHTAARLGEGEEGVSLKWANTATVFAHGYGFY